MARDRHDAQPMDSTGPEVVLFAFHDPARARQVVAAAGNQTAVRSVAVVGRSANCEIRIISRVGEDADEARWIASTTGVLDVLSGPLYVHSGSTGNRKAVTLPDSDEGFAAFGRLIPRQALVILVAVREDSVPSIGSFERVLGAALFGRSPIVQYPCRPAPEGCSPHRRPSEVTEALQ